MQSTHTIDVQTKADQARAAIARAAFLNHVVSDARTETLFEFWMSRIRNEVDGIVAALDKAARLAGRASRSDLAEGDLSPSVRAGLKQWEREFTKLLKRQGLLTESVGFVVSQLYGTTVDEDVPLRWWLGADLVDVFLAKLYAHLHGTPLARIDVPLAPTLNVLTEAGHSSDPETIKRRISWYYRNKVSRVASVGQLAGEYRRACERRGVFHAAKGDGGDRADTKTVRDGIEEARRLLFVAVAPQQMNKLRDFGLIRGGELIN